MKFDRLQIKLVIGLVLCIILYILVAALEHKENITNKNLYMEKKQINIEQNTAI